MEAEIESPPFPPLPGWGNEGVGEGKNLGQFRIDCGSFKCLRFPTCLCRWNNVSV